MGYTLEKWENRIRNRSDFSCYLTHLTRKNSKSTAVENLIKILEDQKIIGSSNSGFVTGENKAVCFQDVPLYSICQNTFHEQQCRKDLGNKVRYRAVGLSIHKQYIYSNGGRPVIYEKREVAKKFIDKSEWWRIVSLDLSDENLIVDWTHEREWRIKGDLQFDLEEIYVILVNAQAYKRFVKLASDEIKSKIKGIVVLETVLS